MIESTDDSREEQLLSISDVSLVLEVSLSFATLARCSWEGRTCWPWVRVRLRPRSLTISTKRLSLLLLLVEGILNGVALSRC